MLKVSAFVNNNAAARAEETQEKRASIQYIHSLPPPSQSFHIGGRAMPK